MNTRAGLHNHLFQFTEHSRVEYLEITNVRCYALAVNLLIN